MKKYFAELLGTCVLVLFGTGVAVFSGGELVPTALAFGLAIIACAYVIGNVSGCHVNPAVSFAMYLSKKLDGKDFLCYVISQILGAFLGTSILYLILSSSGDFIELGANDYIANGISLLAACLVETILTFVFVFTILGVTSEEKNSSVSGLVIGLTLTFVHLFGIGLTGTSVNPARSLAPAMFTGGDALSQVWIYLVFPMVGAAAAAMVFKCLNENKKKSLFNRK